MARAEGEDLLGVQIFMNEASVAIRALPRLLQHAPSIIDINCGCPVPKVVKTGSGSALMREPRKVQEMVRALKEYTDIPVSIKIRTGWDKDSVTFKEVADAALNAGGRYDHHACKNPSGRIFRDRPLERADGTQSLCAQ